MIARLLHGFTDRIPSTRCCGKRWNDLPRHRSFAHGEEVVIPEPHEHEWYYFDLDHKPFPGICMLCGTLAADERIDTRPVGERVSGLGASFSAMTPQAGCLPCFCGAPAVGWVYQVMGDGQAIGGEARCQKHQEEQT